MFTATFWQGHLPSVRAFYELVGYKPEIGEEDTLMVVRDALGRIGAVVRLCNEEGYIVLRGMQVREELRRQDLGTTLLNEVAKVLRKDPRFKKRPCFCLAYTHLAGFYSQVGFEEIREVDAPTFLRTRLKEHRETGLLGRSYIIMRRRPG